MSKRSKVQVVSILDGYRLIYVGPTYVHSMYLAQTTSSKVHRRDQGIQYMNLNINASRDNIIVHIDNLISST